MAVQALGAPMLANVMAKYRARRFNDYPVLPFFPGDELEDDEVAPEEGEVERDYERPLDQWAAIAPRPTDDPSYRRFVDGTIVSRTVASLEDSQGRQRPLLAAVIGAAALELVGGALTRQPQDYEVQTVVAMIAKGVRREDLDTMSRALDVLGIRFLELPARSLSTDFELARMHTFDGARQEMLRLERALVVRALDRPTIVDGVLEDRLEGLGDWDVPVVGVVKRLLRIRNHLHTAGMNLVYSLRPGERTPTILLHTHRNPNVFSSLVSWFLRLHGEADIAPSWGVVRVVMSEEYFRGSLGGNFDHLSEISWWLHQLRCRDRSYQRMPVSLEPIVRVEDHLRGLRPTLEQAIGRFTVTARLG